MFTMYNLKLQYRHLPCKMGFNVQPKYLLALILKMSTCTSLVLLVQIHSYDVSDSSDHCPINQTNFNLI